jgi:putative GTP pyrophosphokinase
LYLYKNTLQSKFLLAESGLDKANLESQLNTNELRYNRLISRVIELLQTSIKKDQISAIPESRVKDFDSFYEKILSLNVNDNFFNAIEDIAGVRFICKYYSDLEKIDKIINEEFNVVRSNRKTLFKRISEFGYLSDHYIVKLKKETTQPSEMDLLDLKCEIQIRTILMHAWDTVSHELAYKKPIIDDETKREFYAISGLLYLADQRFDAYKKTALEKLEKQKHITIAFELQQKITDESLGHYLKWKFPTRLEPKTIIFEEFAQELQTMSYDSFKILDNIITKAEHILPIYEKDHPPRSIGGELYDSVGAARICIGIADTKNKKSNSFYVIDLEKYRLMLNE